MTREQRYRSALKDIADYILPTFQIQGEDYVRLETAVYLREIAREALAQAAGTGTRRK